MPSRTQIVNWITHWLSQKLDVSIMTLRPDVPFADFGLDSVAAVELVEALSDWLPQVEEIDSTLTWNFPTIDGVAQYLTESARRSKPSQPASVDPVSEADLDRLSEADLVALLAAEVKRDQ